jgi:hypothetical protein
MRLSVFVLMQYSLGGNKSLPLQPPIKGSHLRQINRALTSDRSTAF